MQQPDLPRDAVTAPLARHVLFASRDLDEARDRVARVFCPHRLETIGARARLAARHHHLCGERLSLNYIEYGARTLIEEVVAESSGALKTRAQRMLAELG